MEIDVVGFHLNEDVGTCKDCGKSSRFVVVDIASGDDFELCADCLDSGNYEIRKDRIKTAFSKIPPDAENVVNVFDWSKEHNP